MITIGFKNGCVNTYIKGENAKICDWWNEQDFILITDKNDKWIAKVSKFDIAYINKGLPMIWYGKWDGTQEGELTLNGSKKAEKNSKTKKRIIDKI